LRTPNTVEHTVQYFVNLFMHVFSYVLNGPGTNCNCSWHSSGGNFDNKGN